MFIPNYYIIRKQQTTYKQTPDCYILEYRIRQTQPSTLKNYIMIKSREPALERMSVTFQVVLTVLSFYLTLWATGILSLNYLLHNKEHMVLAFIMTPLWFGLLEFFEMGTMARIQRYRHIIHKYIFVVLLGVGALILLVELFELNTIGSKVLLKFALVNHLVLSAQKVIGRSIMRYLRKKGFNIRLIMIIADDNSIPFIDQIIDTSEWGYKIVGIITNSKKVKAKYSGTYPTFSERRDFAKLIDENIVDEVIYCKQYFQTKRIMKHIDLCREVGVVFHIHNNVFSIGGLKPAVSYINRQFLLSFKNTPGNYFGLKLKGTIDFFLTIIILICVAPFMLLIAILIKLDDGGPVLFEQIRVGKHGRHFKLLKFRTMVINAEEIQKDIMDLNEQDGPIFKIKNDPRITRIGKFLRKTSLDELPQFINVLFGDMSIVGPRPPIPSEVKMYERNLTRRLSINPGITCIWQVSGRNNISFKRWMEMDMEYIDNWSLGLDFVIILKTFRVIFVGNGQ